MNNKASGSAMAFFTGITIGSIMAMLFTPRSGTENRAMIKDKLNTAKQKANEKKDSMQEGVQNLTETAKSKVEKTKEFGKQLRNDKSNSKPDESTPLTSM